MERLFFHAQQNPPRFLSGAGFFFAVIGFLSRKSIAHNGTQRFLQLAVILDL